MSLDKLVRPVAAGILFISIAWISVANGEEGDCLSFAKNFESVGVSTSSLGSDYLDQPLPENMRTLEAGYDPACRVGGLADIYIQCPKGDDVRAQTIIRRAPVVWTDPEGFTVVVISLQDHEKLKGRDLFWAHCDGGA